MPVEVPEALRAVVMKAMAREKEGRYRGVGELVADLDAYVGGFATSAEGAGVMRRVRLWVGRNRVLVGAAALFVAMGSGFTAKVIVEGRKASRAMKRLSTSAPVFAARAEELLRSGDFQEALEAADNAVDLDASVAEHHVVRGNVLQVLMRLDDAKRAYGQALEIGKDERAAAGLKLTEEVLATVAKGGEAKGKVALYEGLNRVGRQMEALAFAKELGDFWRAKRKDVSVIPELIKRLEAKMLPVPGTEILLSKTEFTVGEWKLYLRAEGLPDWRQPAEHQFAQTDDHPLIKVRQREAVLFCVWLSRVSGRVWRLPNSDEWQAAAGTTKYPWGSYFPPKQEDGNYAFLSDGGADPTGIGADGVLGTSPVCSFRPNALGFYDLGGNAWEWMADQLPKERGFVRGGGFSTRTSGDAEVSRQIDNQHPSDGGRIAGFRLALEVAH
jgi:tetratricopeptide (TPR) repeat protein